MTRTVAFPLHVEEIKTQPSLDRVNAMGSTGFEIEDASSSTETRLFNFFSPEKRMSDAPASGNPQIAIATKTINLVLILPYCQIREMDYERVLKLRSRRREEADFPR